MMVITSSMRCSLHELESSYQMCHLDGLRPETLRNSRTVGRREPRVPETKLKVSPASASISRDFPTLCLPTTMNCGMGKSTDCPQLESSRAFTLETKLRSSWLPLLAIDG